MDRIEGHNRRLREIEPAAEIPIDEQNEPWGWGDKVMPERTKHALMLYREFLESQGDKNGD
jgi:hypothetical protein